MRLDYSRLRIVLGEAELHGRGTQRNRNLGTVSFLLVSMTVGKWWVMIRRVSKCWVMIRRVSKCWVIMRLRIHKYENR